MTEYELLLRDADILSCCLLGEYNEDNKYVIDSKIVNDLVSSIKTINSYKEEGIDCEAEIGAFKFKFKITFTVVDNLKYATMYLNERYVFLNAEHKVQTFLVRYSDYDDVNYLDKVKQAFNLVTKDESEGKDIKNDFPLIIELKNRKKDVSKKVLTELSNQNKLYIMEVIRILKNSGEFGTYIQALLKEQIKNIKEDKLSPKFWAEVKKCLDTILLTSREKYPDETRILLEQINKTYIDVYKEKLEQAKKQAKKANVFKKKSGGKSPEPDDPSKGKFDTYKVDIPTIKVEIPKYEKLIGNLSEKYSHLNTQMVPGKPIFLGVDVTITGSRIFAEPKGGTKKTQPDKDPLNAQTRKEYLEKSIKNFDEGQQANADPSVLNLDNPSISLEDELDL